MPLPTPAKLLILLGWRRGRDRTPDPQSLLLISFSLFLRSRSGQSTSLAAAPGSLHRNRPRPFSPHARAAPTARPPGNRPRAADLVRDVVASGPPCAGR